MGENLEVTIRQICKAHDNDRTRLMDIVLAVQEEFGCVSGEAMEAIASEVSTHRVEVESVVSFYSFLSDKPKGKFVIRLCDDIIDRTHGGDLVAQAFCDELGIDFGQTTECGTFTLEYTPCIGMCDQAPAALINDKVITRLSSDSVRTIVQGLRDHADLGKLNFDFGDGNNAHELVQSMVVNNIRKRGPVIFYTLETGSAISKAVSMSPVEVINEIKNSRLRGRGGAGFPTGMKWEFTRGADGDHKYILCNADEGEPGTFKDRVILTETPDLLFEGMTIAGYAIGAKTGILYLRGEYNYLRPFLEKVLADRRANGLLGKNISGNENFDFDIRIQMGAGAYICGEETALISSCEGLRGDPKNRPPFPAQKGYLQAPTSVNNVETLCCVARILDKGPGWFVEQGTAKSAGTKLLSISGDCKSPGVFEVPMGISLREVLAMAGAEDSIAVQMGGPSGTMIGPADFDRTICFDDLATGGSVMVFSEKRNVLEVTRAFMDFFCEESCGYCTPCRAGNELLVERLEKIMDGKGEPADLDYLKQLGESVKTLSRCGLGQTSPNPILTTLENFRPVYEKLVSVSEDGLKRSFDINKALSVAEGISGRKSEHFGE